jgi:Na+/phosphate symporter
MKHNRVFIDPFSLLSPELDRQVLKLEEMHRRPFDNSVTLEEGLLLMISKILELTRILSRAVSGYGISQMDQCEDLARDVDQQEQALTGQLVASELSGDLRGGLIRVPGCLERIGDMVEAILKCFRTRAGEGIPLSDKAQSELDQLFVVLLDMTQSMRDSLITPDPVALEYILCQGKKLEEMLCGFRLAHWDRLSNRDCDHRASSEYLAILDSIGTINQYLENICNTLIQLGASLGKHTATAESVNNKNDHVFSHTIERQ